MTINKARCYRSKENGLYCEIGKMKVSVKQVLIHCLFAGTIGVLLFVVPEQPTARYFEINSSIAENV